jgi:GDPmannose 4,6-dehydratase
MKENKNFKLLHGDITDSVFISDLISEIKPEKIFNLAAQSHVGYSFTNPISTFEVDALSVMNMLSSIHKYSPETRFYQASTSELFGGINCPDTGYTESSRLYPRSPYGVAKLAAYWSTINYRESYDLFACNGILFNHGGPRRGLDFFERKLSHNVAKIKLGLIDHISFGNLTAKRDLGSAKDYVIAMYKMLEADSPEEYVISTGKTYEMSEMVDIMFDIAGIKDSESYIKIDPSLYRPAEVPVLLGDSTKARTKLNWTPKQDIYSLFEEMYKNDLELLKN